MVAFENFFLPRVSFTLVIFSKLIRFYSLLKTFVFRRNISKLIYWNSLDIASKIWRRSSFHEDQRSLWKNDINLFLANVLIIYPLRAPTTLTHFKPALHFIKKPDNWFAMEIKWLVSIWNATLSWNELMCRICSLLTSETPERYQRY